MASHFPFSSFKAFIGKRLKSKPDAVMGGRLFGISDPPFYMVKVQKFAFVRFRPLISKGLLWINEKTNLFRVFQYLIRICCPNWPPKFVHLGQMTTTNYQREYEDIWFYLKLTSFTTLLICKSCFCDKFKSGHSKAITNQQTLKSEPKY